MKYIPKVKTAMRTSIPCFMFALSVITSTDKNHIQLEMSVNFKIYLNKGLKELMVNKYFYSTLENSPTKIFNTFPSVLRIGQEPTCQN